MKNKEIEELLIKIKNAIKKHKEEDLQDDMLVILELDVIQWQLLLSRIEQLEEEIKEYKFLIKMQNSREYRSKFLKEFQKEHGTNVFPDYDEIYKRYDKLKEENKQLEKENKILKENAKHNDKVVDKVNLEINMLKHNRDKAIKKCQDKQYQTNHEWLKKFAKELENLLKGGSDE